MTFIAQDNVTAAIELDMLFEEKAEIARQVSMVQWTVVMAYVSESSKRRPRALSASATVSILVG